MLPQGLDVTEKVKDKKPNWLHRNTEAILFQLGLLEFRSGNVPQFLEA